jgi:hypothetical protein
VDKEKQPVIIRKDRCVITIYDVANFLWQGVDVRGLWKLMFSAPQDNEYSITLIRDWLPTAIRETEAIIPACREELARTRRVVFTADIRLTALRQRKKAGQKTTETVKQLKSELADAKRNARSAERRLKMAIADHDRAISLQELFKTMAHKAKI